MESKEKTTSWEEFSSVVLVKRGGSISPFSKDILSRSIQASGLAPHDAFNIARRVESKVLRGKRKQMTASRVKNITDKFIRNKFGDTYADRYLFWQNFETSKKPFILIIGGSTGVGKTSLSIEIAHRLGINKIISTDDIRQMMRLMFSQELMPYLYSSSYEAWKSINFPIAKNVDPVIEGYNQQSLRINVGIRAIIERSIVENEHIIINGIHCIPGFLNLEDYIDKAYILLVIITYFNKDDYKNRFKQRFRQSPRRKLQKYLDNFENIWKIQNYLYDLADEWNVPIIHNIEFDNSISLFLGLSTEFLLQRCDEGVSDEKIRERLKKEIEKKGIYDTEKRNITHP